VVVRVLRSGDEAQLEAFLVRHAESSVFLRANVRMSGLEDRGEPYQATYAAAVDGDRVIAVAAHAWTGGVVLQAPEHLEAVVRHAVERSGRRVRGFVGPWAQVVAAREALGLVQQPARMESRETLYTLALADLIVPDALASGAVACRRPTGDELPLIVEWRTAYNVEANHVPADAAGRVQARDEAHRWHAERAGFLLTHAGEPVAYSAFNARLPDTVQVGGVWTPPALRSRGYARCVVAGSLLSARGEGVERAILFTGEGNLPARRAYEALGFRAIGDYGLVFFSAGR
jgi:RimJ/RimL family protein N-acetyltransferase